MEDGGVTLVLLPEPLELVDVRVPDKLPFDDPSDWELAEYDPPMVPLELILPFNVAVVSTGVCPSFPEIVKVAPPEPVLTVTRPVHATTTPTLHTPTFPFGSTEKLPDVPSLVVTEYVPAKLAWLDEPPAGEPPVDPVPPDVPLPPVPPDVTDAGVQSVPGADAGLNSNRFRGTGLPFGRVMTPVFVELNEKASWPDVPLA